MGNKDLTKEYAKKAYYEKLNKEHVIWRDKVFNACDISKAFNAGRESVVENIPELEWREEICRDKSFLEAYALGAYYLIRLKGPEFYVSCNYRCFASYTSLTAAKQSADEDYKKRIKQALGL